MGDLSSHDSVHEFTAGVIGLDHWKRKRVREDLKKKIVTLLLDSFIPISP
jgi:hypothetical protein